MKTNLDILKWLMPLAVLLATACGHDDLVPPDVYVEETTPYVELRIAVPLANPASTRANPMGGEEGNGRERGTLNEDKIHDINVFFYDDSEYGGNGMDSDPETPIVHYIYYNIDDNDDPLNSKLKIPEGETIPPYYEKYYLKLQFECPEDLIGKANGLKFLAIANLGPKQFSDNMKLKDLTGLQLEYYNKGSGSWSTTNDAFSNNAKNMDYFLMSTAYNDNHSYDESYSINATGDNTINKCGDNYLGTTTLQRLYARLDLWYNDSSNSPDENAIKNEDTLQELKYQVVDENEESIKDKNGVIIKNTVYLTNVLPVNVMQQPSFLFKMVTKEEMASFDSDAIKKILSAEKYLWGGKESPNDFPTATSPADKPLNFVIEPYTKYKNDKGTVGEYKNSNGTGNLTDWYGNTTADNVKTDILSDDNGKLSAYYHESRPYDSNYRCNHISIISYANENTQPIDCYNSSYLTGLAFRAVYVPEKIFNDYDADTKTLVAMTKDERSSFDASNRIIYRYSPSKDRVAKEQEALYFTSETVLKEYEKDNQGDSPVVTAFYANREPKNNLLGIVCYYNIWLRHYNDKNGNPTEDYPMEYATVRNNIYRVSVSFTGPGEPSPTMREPDTMKARIFVRKWNFRAEDTFYFE